MLQRLAHGAREALYLRDPAQNTAALYWDLPAEDRHRNTSRGLEIFTRPLNRTALFAAA